MSLTRLSQGKAEGNDYGVHNAQCTMHNAQCIITMQQQTIDLVSTVANVLRLCRCLCQSTRPSTSARDQAPSPEALSLYSAPLSCKTAHVHSTNN